MRVLSLVFTSILSLALGGAGFAAEDTPQGEKEPVKPPAQATGLSVIHRAGQSFITWKDTEDTLGDKPVTWGALRDALRKAEDSKRVCYRLYRHRKPIDATSVRDATLLAEIQPFSGFNVNSWSLERLINQVIFSNADRGELGVYGPFNGWNRESRQGERLVIPRFAIEDRTVLPAGTGLHVHSPAVAEKSYYAVTLVANGAENLTDFSAANSLAQPVEEAAAAWAPVEQPDTEPFGFDFRGKRRYYVTWVAPPLAPKPMYFNWSVLVPPDCTQPAPVELFFHAPGYSYARPPVKFLERSIQICPHDFPFSGWYGYNELLGSPKSRQEGVVRPYTIRRTEAFLKWAQTRFPVDPTRIIPVGGDGAALMAVYRPELCAYAIITGFQSLQLDPKSAESFAEAWGPSSPQLKDENGLAEWKWGELDFLLCGKCLPSVVKKDEPLPSPAPATAPGMKLELPLFVCRGYSWGRDPAYGHGRGRLYYALQATRHALHAHWAWGGNLTAPQKFTGLWQGLDITRATPIPAITYSSADKEGEGAGHCNVGYTWQNVKEDADSFEVTISGAPSTFDLTPRRLSAFKIQPGETLAWEALPSEVRGQKSEPKLGQEKADENGLVTLKGLELQKTQTLKIRISRAKK